jgi:hypothetical protein
MPMPTRPMPATRTPKPVPEEWRALRRVRPSGSELEQVSDQRGMQASTANHAKSTCHQIMVAAVAELEWVNSPGGNSGNPSRSSNSCKILEGALARGKARGCLWNSSAADRGQRKVNKAHTRRLCPSSDSHGHRDQARP